MNKPLSIASGFVLVGLLFSQPALALVPGTAAESPPTSSLSTSATAAAAAAATGFIIAKKAKAKAADKKAGKADTGEGKADTGKKSTFPSKAESLKDIDDISKK